MLIQSGQMHNVEIVNMRTGQPEASIQQGIIDPFRLLLCGFYTSYEPNILLTSNIRELNLEQALIDDVDAFSAKSELPRLEEVLSIDYQLLGKRVQTRSQKNLGKVEEYVFDSIEFKIQKIYIHQPMWRNINGQTLIVDRRQILEVNDKHIVVADAIVEARQALNPQHTA